ncbi:MAG: PilZ domain-containing protein [Candidatus Aureabacteria bacterium]|nr:PilZ domain-containing protein [Candidatus Auribacterota bacterium]
MTIKERRNYERIDVPFKLLHAPFFFPGIKNEELIPGEILNVSAIGVFFKTTRLYEPGTLVRIEIKMGSWDNYKNGFQPFKYLYRSEPFVVLGQVMRCTKEPSEENIKENHFQVAVKYISVDEGHQSAVAKFIQKLAKKNKVMA